MKPFKTIDEQIKILEERGMTFNDYNRAKNYLLTNNYYSVINGYSKFFMVSDSDSYLHGTSFDEITKVQFFEREIKSAFMKYIILVEQHFKAILSHRFAEYFPYKPYAYLRTETYDISNNANLLKASSLTAQLTNVLNKFNGKKDPNAIKHYRNNHNDVPIWVLQEYLSFGQINFMYSLLPFDLRGTIAKDLLSFAYVNYPSFHSYIEPVHVDMFLHNIREVRNVAAHNNLMLNMKCRYNIPYYKGIQQPNDIRTSVTTQDVYNVYLILGLFLSKTEYRNLQKTIRKRMTYLNNSLHTISGNKITNSLGFPVDWFK